VAAQGVDHVQQVFDHDVLAVDAIRRPVGIAVAARIEGHRVVAGGAERLAGALPGVAGLATPVLQQHQWSLGIAPGIAGDHHPAGTPPAVHGFRGAR
jgi:hypothetical protein